MEERWNRYGSKAMHTGGWPQTAARTAGPGLPPAGWPPGTGLTQLAACPG